MPDVRLDALTMPSALLVTMETPGALLGISALVFLLHTF